jgi:ketosteroid isomerase-like protein
MQLAGRSPLLSHEFRLMQRHRWRQGRSRGDLQAGQDSRKLARLLGAVAPAPHLPARDTARAMSQENIEVVQWVYEGLSKRRAMPLDRFHSDFEADGTDVAPDIGVVRGADDFQAAFLSYAETFDAFRVEIQQVINADREHVVTLVRDGGRVRGSNAEVWNRFFHVWTFEGRELIRFSTHTDRGRALQAAGLSE